MTNAYKMFVQYSDRPYLERGWVFVDNPVDAIYTAYGYDYLDTKQPIGSIVLLEKDLVMRLEDGGESLFINNMMNFQPENLPNDGHLMELNPFWEMFTEAPSLTIAYRNH